MIRYFEKNSAGNEMEETVNCEETSLDISDLFGNGEYTVTIFTQNPYEEGKNSTDEVAIQWTGE